jgi:Tol biopolymer transport system component
MDIETRETYRLKGPIASETGVERLRLDYQPTWSPDGQWIAYTSSTLRPETDIYKIRSDGTEETKLTNHLAPDVQPTWSPDSSQIAFVSWRRDDPLETFLHPYEKNIFIMNADGSNVRRLTDDRETENTAPLWSQDGQWIIYNVMDGPGRFTEMLVRQNLITHEKQVIRQTKYLGITSDQSPDGAWLVFDEWQFGDPNIKLCFIQLTGQHYQCLRPPALSIPAIYARWQPVTVP